MAQAANPDERIALGVQTSYDGSGIRAARADNSALGREARATAKDLETGASQGAAAERSLAGAARDAANAQQQVTITGEQSRAMWAKAGGDYSRFLELVKQHVAQVRGLAAAEREAAAAAGGVAAGGVGAGGPADRIDRISSKARTAANALSTMAFFAAEGAGGTRSLAIAAGSAADGLASLSGNAKLVASAAGLGAVLTVGVAVVTLFNRMEERAKAAGEAMGRSLGDFADQALDARAAAVEASFQAAQRRVTAAGQGRGFLSGILPGLSIDLVELTKANNELTKITAKREAIVNEQQNRRRNKGRETSEDQIQREKRDAERSRDLQGELTNSILDQYEKRTLSAEGAARAKVEREWKERQDEIAALLVHEDIKTQLIASAARDRAEKLKAITDDKNRRENEADDKLFKEQQDRYARSLEMVKNQAEAALHAAITSGESYIRAVTRTLLTPLVRKLEAVAVEQSIDALAEAAFFNFVGAARHAAAAAAAIAGAQRIASWAGLTAGGGGGTAIGGGAFGGAGTGNAGGNVTLIVQTVDPRSGAVVEEVGYQLQRNGILKKPPMPGGTLGLGGGFSGYVQ